MTTPEASSESALEAEEAQRYRDLAAAEKAAGGHLFSGHKGSLTVYGHVPGDQPGGPTYDSDSWSGIGHIHGQPFNLDTPGPQPAAMHPEFAALQYPGLSPGGVYLSKKDGKFHRWMDTTGSKDPANEDLYVGPGQGKSYSGSPLAAFKEQYPLKAKTWSDEMLMDGMRKAYAPHMDKGQFNTLVQQEGGMDQLESHLPLIDRYYNTHPEARQKFKSDDDLVNAVYNGLVKAKKINPEYILPGDIHDYLIPKNDFVSTGIRWARDFLSDLEPQTKLLYQSVRKGLLEANESTAINSVNDSLARAYPGADIAAIRTQYDALSADQREQKYVKDFFANHKGATPDVDPMALKDQMVAGYSAIEKAKDRAQAIAQLSKSIGEVQAQQEKYKPDEPEFIRQVAQLPALAILNAVPGLRELGTYGMLYNDNLNVLRTAKPELPEAELRRQVSAATDAQAAVWEVVALASMGSAGPLGAGARSVSQSVMQKLGKAATSGAIATGALDATQVIQNIAAGKHPASGLGGQTLWGIATGVGPHLPGLTVDGLSHAIRASPELFRKLGHSEKLRTGEPSDINKHLAGDRNNEIDKGVTRDAHDLISSGLLTLTPGFVEELPERAAFALKRTPELYPREVERTRELYRAANEKFNEAFQARKNGDLDKASQKLNEGMAALPKEAAERVQKTTAQVLAVAAGKDPGPFTPDTDKAVDNFFGIKVVPLEEQTGEITPSDQALGFVFNPFRRKWEEPAWITALRFKFREVTDPGKASVSASDMESVIRRVNPKVQQQIGQDIREISEEHFGPPAKEDFRTYLASLRRAATGNYILNDLTHAARRDNWMSNFSKAALTELGDWYEAGKSFLDLPINSALYPQREMLDRYFKWYRGVTDYLERQNKDFGIEMGHVENYIFHMTSPIDNAQGKTKAFQNHYFASPAWTHERRLPTMKDMEAAGLHPVRNPERSLHYRLASQQSELRKIIAMHQAVDIPGLAIPKEIRSVKDGTLIDNPAYGRALDREEIRTADGKHYKVSPEVARVILNAYENTSIYRGALGPFFRFAQILKGFSAPLRLAWSPFHAIHVAHILASDFASMSVGGIRQSPKAVWQYLLTGLPGYHNKYTDLLDVYNFKRAPNPEEAQHLEDLHEMGLWLGASQERKTEWEALNVFQRTGAGKVGRVGYDLFLLKPIQEMLFGRMIPSAKAMSALERANTLVRQVQAREGINLRDPEHALRRQREFTKIGKQTDARFGEMYYDNLLWKRWAKQVGTASLLSLGWQLGFLKIYGEGIADYTGNIKAWATGEPGPGLTNALAYASIYTGSAVLVNLLASWALGGPPQNGSQAMMDGFYPRIGKKPNGDDDRVRPPWFTSEWGSIAEHVTSAGYRQGDIGHGITAPFNLAKGAAVGLGEMALNKLNPGISDLSQLVFNQDFFKRKILDDNSPTMTNLLHLANWAFSTAGPISAQNVFASDPTMSTRAQVAATLGFGPAPVSANRTPLENEIIARYTALNPRGTEGYASQEWYNARQQLRNALSSGNTDAIHKSVRDFRAIGANDRQINDVHKNYRIPTASYLFKRLGYTKDGQAVQLHLLKYDMTSEELDHYWRFAARAVKERYNRERSSR